MPIGAGRDEGGTVDEDTMSRPMTIAIVDDEPDMRESISQWLVLSGFETQTFASAEDASQHLIREHLVSTVPWDEAGAFLRFSATFESAGPGDDARVIGELGRRLADAQLEFGP